MVAILYGFKSLHPHQIKDRYPVYRSLILIYKKGGDKAWHTLTTLTFAPAKKSKGFMWWLICGVIGNVVVPAKKRIENSYTYHSEDYMVELLNRDD